MRIRNGCLGFRHAGRNTEWELDLILHDTIESIKAETHDDTILACFRHPRKASRWIGAIHVADQEDADVHAIHEAVHAAASFARTVRRFPLAARTEESMARTMQNNLKMILDFYGYEIRKKEEA